MVALDRRRVDALHQRVRALYACHDVERLPQLIIEQARGLVGACHTSFNLVSPAERSAELWMDRGDDPAHLRALFTRYLREHPAIERYLGSGDPSTRKISDFVSARQFHRTGIYQHLYRPLGIEDQMGFCLAPPGPQMQALALGRERRSFTETDRALLELIRPHVAQAWRNACAFERLQRQLEAADEALGELGGVRVVLDRALRPRVFPEAARRLLAEHVAGRATGWLPERVARWLSACARADPGGGPACRRPLILRRPGSQLVIRAFADDASGEITLLLERRLLPGGEAQKRFRGLGLTARELEVLAALEQGGRNADIAAALGISPQTVRTHLEHIYDKLGVHSRTAALARLRGYREGVAPRRESVRDAD